MCNLIHRPNRYQYQGFWIEVSLEPDFEHNRVLYIASVELPGRGGVVTNAGTENREEAEFAVEELIDSWN